MSIKLFEHNQTAFDDALEMLEETGKAAVVHPTGTGKSYIGFKLCEQFPDKTICWLSPSEYIYKTQLENLKEDSDGWQPENVEFFTYAKLMLMTEVELQNIQPDFIILDEFHRCGAEMWGDGVNRLLEMYADVPILGLTATAIRYLDNQRNMVDELFDGNIASEMTLGEAIVRGILNPPKYVLSVFAYQEDYDKLKRRVSRSKNKAVKDKAEQYLESLRRALEMADGMDVIFDKHITDRTGKYTVLFRSSEGTQELSLIPLISFLNAKKEPELYRTMYMNMLLFMPLGLSLPFAISDKSKHNILITFLVGILFSITIEVCQYVFSLGRCETDDVIMNTIGVLVGITSYLLSRIILRLAVGAKVKTLNR